MRLRLALAATLALAPARTLAAQDVRPLPELPPRGASVQAFVPQGWKSAQEVRGDLNGDGRADVAFELVSREDEYSDPQGVTAAPQGHGLVILLADAAGGYRRAGYGRKVLVNLAPQYGLQMRIRNGVLVTDQNFGMTRVTDLTHRFRLDPPSGRFILIGKDSFFYTRPQEADESVKSSDNFLTGQRIVTTGRFDAAGRYHESSRRETIPRARTPLESVDESDY